jgi:hypothetical protein
VSGTSGVFTEYVRALAAGVEPPDEQAGALWAALRAALRDDLRRRGLWGASPPSYLGIYGYPRWQAAGAAAAGAATAPTGDALEDLAAGCYAFIFVDRLRSLIAHLAVKRDIDGLVLLNVRHYLHELQREHDPLGFRVFEVARAAVRRALERGELAVVAGDPRVRNETLLGWEGRPSAPAMGAAAAGAELARRVARWGDELLPDLVTARGPRQTEVVDRLRRQLLALREAGFERFRFRDLVDPLKRAVRWRWAAILEQATGRRGGMGGRATAPGDVEAEAMESDASFQELARCVTASLGQLEVDARSRRYLLALWRFLRRRAGAGGEEVEDALARHKVAELLQIPRERMPELYRTLGRLVQACRARSGRGMQAPASARRGGTLGREARGMVSRGKQGSGER